MLDSVAVPLDVVQGQHSELRDTKQQGTFMRKTIIANNHMYGSRT